MTSKAFLQSVLIVFTATVLFACSSDNGSGNTTDVVTLPTAQNELSTKVFLLEDDSIITIEDGGNDIGTLKLDVTQDSADELEDKIVVIHTPDELDEYTFLKITKATVSDDVASNPDNVIVDAEYIVPLLDEVFSEIDIDTSAIESDAEITHFYSPLAYEEDVSPSLLARTDKETATSNASSETTSDYKWRWFHNVSKSFQFKRDKTDGDKFTISFDELEILSYVKEYGLLGGKVSLSGDWSIDIDQDESDISINTNESDPENTSDKKFQITYDDSRQLGLNFEGGFEFKLSEIEQLKKKYKCGVSRVETGELLGKSLGLSGAKWKDSICLGGVRLGYNGVPVVAVLAGNGETSEIKVPIAIDVFITVNLEMLIQGKIELARSYNARVVAGLDSVGGKITTVNKVFDPNTGVAPVPSWFTSGSIEANVTGGIGLAAAPKIAGIYPIVSHIFHETRLDGKLSLDNENGACMSLDMAAHQGFYAALGSTVSLESKNENFEERTWSSGFNLIAEGNITEPLTAVEYDECTHDDLYEVLLDIDNSLPSQATLSNLRVKDPDGDDFYTIIDYDWTILDPSYNRIKSVESPLSVGTLTGLEAGTYTSDIKLTLSDGKELRQALKFEVKSIIVEPDDRQLAVSWPVVPEYTYKVCVVKRGYSFIFDCENTLAESSDVALFDNPSSPVVVSNLVNETEYNVILLTTDANGNVTETITKATPTVDVTPQNVVVVEKSKSVEVSWLMETGVTYQVCISGETNIYLVCNNVSTSNTWGYPDAVSPLEISGLENNHEYQIVINAT